MPDIQAKYDDLKAKFDKSEEKNKDLENKIKDMVKERDDFKNKLETLENQIVEDVKNRKAKRISEIKNVVDPDKADEVEELLKDSMHLDEEKFERFAKSTLNTYKKQNPEVAVIDTKKIEDKKDEDVDKELEDGFKKSEVNELQEAMYGKKK